jgi:hypothetical protein
MAKKMKKAGKKAAPELVEQSADGAAPTADSRALPAARVRVEDVEVLRAVVEAVVPEIVQQVIEGLQGQLPGSEQVARTSALAPPDGDDAMGRLLATTSEIRERVAREEKAVADIQRRLTILEENQRPPPPAPDREAAARKAMGRRIVANQCRASNHTRPTPAIVGRMMNDERAFDQRTAKSPHVLFDGILVAVRRIFGPAVPEPGKEAVTPGQDYVHLTKEIVAVIEGWSSIPKRKQSDFLNDELKPRLAMLVNSGLAEVVPKRIRNPPHYDRFLTPLGRELFDGWPEWDDATGGIGLAEELMPPAPAVGRPVIEAAAPPEPRPASPPPQPFPQPPTSQPSTPPST